MTDVMLGEGMVHWPARGHVMTTALLRQEPHLDTLWNAGLLCDVCQCQPWTQHARTCTAVLCADCAQGEPVEDETP